jgi:hypothetical protein
MSRALCICDVVIDSRGAAVPATEAHRNNILAGNFPMSWTITPFSDLRRIAIGLAEVSTPQSNNLQLDTGMAVADLPANWVTLTWGNIQNAKQTEILNFLVAHSIDTSAIVDAMPLPGVVDYISNQIRPGRKLVHLETELSMNFGV